MIRNSATGRRILQLALFMLVFGLAMLVNPLVVQAGQGGTTQTDSSPTMVILGGLLVVVIAAGVGLVVSRRKK